MSKRHFYQQIATDGLITKEEALVVMMTNTLPLELEAIVAALPADAEFDAGMLLATNEYHRNNSFVAVFAA